VLNGPRYRHSGTSAANTSTNSHAPDGLSAATIGVRALTAPGSRTAESSIPIATNSTMGGAAMSKAR
jgi:hypothetical protein